MRYVSIIILLVGLSTTLYVGLIWHLHYSGSVQLPRDVGLLNYHPPILELETLV